MDFTLSIFLIMSAAFSAIMMVGAFVFPDIMFRMTDASTTRRFSMPLNLKKNQCQFLENIDIYWLYMCMQN